MQLNREQQAAVDHRGTPLLVLAGAGTGKTRVITHRVAALLAEGVPAWRILAVTFTNKAAAEMRERILRLCADVPEVERMWVGTFHSIAARILRRHGTAVGLSRSFTIYDTEDQMKVMRRALKDLDIDSDQASPRAILTHLDRAKNRGLPISRLEKLGIDEPILSYSKRAGQRYEKLVRDADAADFGDLLTLTVELLERAGQAAPGSQLADLDPALGLKKRFWHVVVDEYQDTNPVQARMVELLSEKAELVVVGDDDQSIYGWRGADVSQILGFPDAHAGCRLIRLEQNYRSTGHILRCADAVIRKNAGRLGKTLWSDLGDGARVQIRQLRDERAEAGFVVQQIFDGLNEDIPAHEIAVFYRTHAQSRALEEALSHNAVRYSVYGGPSFYSRREIKDLLAYLRLLINPASDEDFMRIVNVPSRKIGDTTVTRLREFAAGKGMALLPSLALLDTPGVTSELGAAACKRLAGFRELMAGFAASHAAGRPLGALAEEILASIHYIEVLKTEETEEAEERVDSLEELVGALHRFGETHPGQGLAEFLEQVSLATDADRNSEHVQGVRLMTIHSAKGLEFTRVILTGMEENVFPHVRSIHDATQMEEERRLAYVAVTRAKRDLIITWTEERFLNNQRNVSSLSRFVRDLPAESVDRGRTARQASRASSWNSDIVYDGDEAPAAPVRRRPAAAASSSSAGPGVFVGMAVRHAQFGTAEVVGWDGAGSTLKLYLRFADSATRVILARFCEPL
ncbi:MAG: UvrD-helicase domain-containing protein [Myxococcales bacterium]|nr:UvrD-helicase domain-containing protein [Myxococcales bacterium]